MFSTKKKWLLTRKYCFFAQHKNILGDCQEIIFFNFWKVSRTKKRITCNKKHWKNFEDADMYFFLVRSAPKNVHLYNGQKKGLPLFFSYFLHVILFCVRSKRWRTEKRITSPTYLIRNFAGILFFCPVTILIGQKKRLLVSKYMVKKHFFVFKNCKWSFFLSLSNSCGHQKKITSLNFNKIRVFFYSFSKIKTVLVSFLFWNKMPPKKKKQQQPLQQKQTPSNKSKKLQQDSAASDKKFESRATLRSASSASKPSRTPTQNQLERDAKRDQVRLQRKHKALITLCSLHLRRQLWTLSLLLV